MLRPWSDLVIKEAHGVALIKGPTGNYRLASGGEYKTICQINPQLDRETQKRWAGNLFKALTGEDAI